MAKGNEISDTVLDIIKALIIALIGYIIIRGIWQAAG